MNKKNHTISGLVNVILINSILLIIILTLGFFIMKNSSAKSEANDYYVDACIEFNGAIQIAFIKDKNKKDSKSVSILLESREIDPAFPNDKRYYPWDWVDEIVYTRSDTNNGMFSIIINDRPHDEIRKQDYGVMSLDCWTKIKDIIGRDINMREQ